MGVNKCYDCRKDIEERLFLCSKCFKKDTVPLQRRKGMDWEDTVIEGEGGSAVHGRDLVQAYKDGRPNQKFMDRYGDGIYKNKKNQLDGKGNPAPVVERDFKEVDV